MFTVSAESNGLLRVHTPSGMAPEVHVLKVLADYFAIVVLIFSLCPSVVQAKNIASIVYGSFTNRQHAESFQQRLEVQLGKSLQIRQIDVRGTHYFRVLGAPQPDIPELRDEL